MLTAAAPDRRRFFLIFNRSAGRSRVATVEQIIAALHMAGGLVVQSTAATAEGSRQQAAEAARSGDFDCIVAAGGDGTIRQAAAAVLGTSCPLGCIMLGTGNVLAYELGLPRDVEGVVAMLRHGRVESFEMARANGEPFLLMAGAGFDGRVMATLDHGIKAKFGKAAFVQPTLRALALPLDRLEVTIDGVRQHAAWAIITNSSRYGGHFVLTERTSLRTPGLQAILFHATSKPRLVAQLSRLALGTLDRVATNDVTFHACSSATISAAHAVPVQIDGDAFGTTPLRIETTGEQVVLITPK